MLAHSILAISLVVRIYDGYDIPSDRLARARATVEHIMTTSASVGVTWTPCPCVSSVSPGELVIRIAAAPPTIGPGVLGFSWVDVERRSGTLAHVFADRVQAMAAVAGVDEGELLGRVIAHEIAHLLLGTHSHSERGLMRSGWKASELARERPSEWLLSRADRIEIRRAIWRRTSESPPALLAADLDAPSE